MTARKLGEQISAVRKAVKIVSGAERPPQAARERDYLAECVEAAVVTLAFVQEHEEIIREAVRGKSRQ